MYSERFGVSERFDELAVLVLTLGDSGRFNDAAAPSEGSALAA